MIATLSSKGQLVLPKAVRDLAGIQTGDELDVGYVSGLIVLRKPEPLNNVRLQQILKKGHNLPQFSPDDETAVADAIARVRSRAAGK